MLTKREQTRSSSVVRTDWRLKEKKGDGNTVGPQSPARRKAIKSVEKKLQRRMWEMAKQKEASEEEGAG